jgi:hypothetical protein
LNFRFADFEIDVARHELQRADAVILVEPQVFDTRPPSSPTLLARAGSLHGGN